MMVTLLRGLQVVFAFLAAITWAIRGNVGAYTRAGVYAQKRARSRRKARGLAAAAAIAIAAIVSVLGSVAQPQTVVAAAQNTLNYQARLQTNPGGAIVADGNYNLEFKLYDASSSTGATQGSCTGDSHCLWTETYTGANKVRVAHGYLTVNLGSLTAFPSTINWDQNLYITMNVGGTGTPGWNGEMNPRLALTAVPYALGAAQLTKLNNSTGFRSTLNLTPATGGNQSFVLPDMGAAGTYTLSTTGNVIQNTTASSLQTNANIAIQSAADSSTTAYFQGRTNQTADLVQLKLGSSQTGNALNIVDGSNNPLFKIDSVGVLTQVKDANFGARLAVGGNVASGVQLSVTGTASNIALQVNGNGTQSIADFRNGSTSVATIGNTGQTTFQNSANSSSAFQVQNSSGNSLINVDTTMGYVVNNGTTAADNLLQNSSFEAGGNTNGSSGWNTGTGWNIVNSAANAHTGNKVYTNTNQTNFTPSTVGFVAVQPGESYYLESYYKIAAGTDGTFSLRTTWIDKDLAGLGTTTVLCPAATTSYALCAERVVAPAGAQYAGFTYVVAGRTTGTYYFDDAYMAKVSKQSPVLLQNTIDTTNAFQVQTAGGNQILTVDTSGAQVVLGKPGASGLSGKLTFQNASNTNTVTIQSGTTSGSYTLTLPTGIAATGQCLAAGTVSGGNVPLQFSDCTNGVTSVVLGGSVANGASISGTQLTIGVADATNPGFVSTGAQTIAGDKTLQSSANSITALNVKKTVASGGGSVFDVDTTNGRVGVNNATPGYALDVTGSINVTTGNTYKIAGTDICTASGCTASAGSAIQNGTSVQTNASLAISSAADANITAYLQGRASQSADLLQLKLGATQSGNAINIVDSSNNPLFKIASTGVLTQTQDANFSARLAVGTSVASGIQLKVLAASSNVGLQVDGNGTQSIADFRNGSTSVLTLGNTGQTTFQNSTDSATALNVKQSAGAGGASVFDVDTQNGRVGIGNAAPSYKLDVNGSVNVTTGNTYKIAGTDICTASGCTASAASAIQNSTSVQTNASLAISSAADANITALLQGRASQSADLFQLKGGSSQTGNYINIVNSGNSPLFTITSTGVLTQVQDANFSARLSVGTTVASGIQLKVLAAASNVGLQVDGNGTQGIADFRNGSTSVATIGNTGQVTLQNSANSANALTVKKTAASGGANVLNVDTQNGRVNINNSATNANALDVGGDINADGSGSVFKINGTTICTINGCTPAVGSNRYIQNTTTLQAGGNSFAIQAANDTDITAYIEGRASQSASLLQMKGGSTQTGDYIKILNSANANVFNINSTGNGTFSNNLTTSGYQGIGVAASSGAQLRITPATTSTIGLLVDGTTSTAGTSVIEANVANSGSLKYNGAGTMTLTSGTSQTAALGIFTLASTSGTQTDGLVINKNGTGGTTTNGATISQTSGTLTNGLAFSGTIGSDIFRGSGTALTLNGVSGISFKTNSVQTFSLGSTGDALFKNTSDSSTAFRVQDSGGAAMLTLDTNANSFTVGSSTTDTTAVLLVLDSYSTLADPTGIEGAMYYNTNSKSFRCYFNGTWRGCVSGVVFASTAASNTVSGTTAETAFNQTYTIPANDCQPGRAYRILATGLMSTQGGLAGQSNLMMRVKLGSTVVADSPSSASGGSLANRQWRINAQFTCTAAGVSGTVESGGTFTHYTSNIASVDWEMVPASNPVTINTTTSQTLQISVQWSTTNAANSIIMRQFIVDAGGN